MYEYALTKLNLMIDSLTISQPDVRKRLSDSYVHIHRLESNDFPPSMQTNWNRISNELTKYDAVYNSKGEVILSSVDNTMRKIKNSTGSKIAKHILTLRNDLNAHEEKLRLDTKSS